MFKASLIAGLFIANSNTTLVKVKYSGNYYRSNSNNIQIQHLLKLNQDSYIGKYANT